MPVLITSRDNELNNKMARRLNLYFEFPNEWYIFKIERDGW